VEGAAELKVLILAISPVAELRAAIPLGLALGLSPAVTFFLALAGNLLPVPLLLWMFRVLVPLAPRLPKPLGIWAGRYLDWQRRRHSPRFDRLGSWALVLFVAVPLPGTGAWTGSLLAALLGLEPRRAGPAIALGVGLAGVVVLLISLGVRAAL